MKSWQLNSPGQAPKLVEKDVAQPKPGAGEVLIRVHAAGITPTELAWYPTTHQRDGSNRAGAVPSHEFSGEIAQIGDGVFGWKAGQEIFGMNDWFADGALAEYCVAQPASIAPKPQNLTHAEAASVPIGALTAWQGLFARARLEAGERVLVHGGTGAVGVFAIQLARWRGAYVITTVSAHNREFAMSLGASEALDYRSVLFENTLRDIDVVFDGVGGDTLQRSWTVLKPNGRLVTIAADSEETSDERTKKAFFIVEPNGAQLQEIARMIDAGDLRPIVDKTVPFARASDAYENKVERSGRGKLVLTMAVG